MKSRILAATVAACVLTTPVTGLAQTSPLVITFQVPLNLKDVSADITNVKVTCMVHGDEAIGMQRKATANWADEKEVEVPVSGGALATTVAVPVTISDTSNATVGTSANYACSLTGFSSSLQRWSEFSETAESAPFRLIPAPQPIAGSFVW